MLAVAGPRVDPRALRAPAGVEVRGYVPTSTACSRAATSRSSTVASARAWSSSRRGRRSSRSRSSRHFEQRIHVAHRLERHGHTRALEVEDATPEGVAEAIADALGGPVDYRAVAPGGAARAAARIAELL